jgi:DNA-binding CsgD family transcriptional regulator
VLFWLGQGKTNAEIGRILGIAERTAETHALHIYPKMGVENRYNAIAALNRVSSLPGQR